MTLIHNKIKQHHVIPVVVVIVVIIRRQGVNIVKTLLIIKSCIYKMVQNLTEPTEHVKKFLTTENDIVRVNLH